MVGPAVGALVVGSEEGSDVVGSLVGSVSCPGRYQIFDNKHSFKSWKTHYRRYHPQNKDYLHITSQRLCDHRNCTVVIPNVDTYCAIHRPVTNLISGIDTTAANTNRNSMNTKLTPLAMIDEHTIVDADRKHFDINRVIRY